MKSSRRSRSLAGIPIFLLGIFALPLSGEEPQRKDTILGQAAGWALDEPETSVMSVESGTALRAEPSAKAQVIAVLPEAQLVLLEWRQTWAKVRFGDQIGWIDIDQVPSLSELPQPSEPRALALEADPQRLDRARRLLDDKKIEGRIGPWLLYSDVKKPSLLERFDRLAGQLEELFTERYGLLPIAAEERGAVVLYARQQTYLDFNQQEADEWVDRGASGHAVPGMAVFHADNESRDELMAVMIHELTHLLTWQAFGRHLPWWLEEGLAEDLALSRFRIGRLEATPLERGNLRYGQTLGVAFAEVRLGLGDGRLPAIVQLLDTQRLRVVESKPHDAQLHYAVAAFWVRFLLLQEKVERSASFRAFLAAVASGEEPDLKSLQAHLDRPLDEVIKEFKLWLRQREEAFAQPLLRRP